MARSATDRHRKQETERQELVGVACEPGLHQPPDIMHGDDYFFASSHLFFLASARVLALWRLRALLFVLFYPFLMHHLPALLRVSSPGCHTPFQFRPGRSARKITH